MPARPPDRVRRYGGTVAVVAVLVVICATAWVSAHEHLPDPSARVVAPSGLDGRYARDSLALVRFGDGAEDYSHVQTFDDLVGMKFLGEAEIAVFRGRGAGPARVEVASRLPEGKLVAVVVKMADRPSAVAAADEINALNLAVGMLPVADAAGVRRAELAQSARQPRPIARAVYVHGDLLTRVELIGVPDRPVTQAFSALLSRQLALVPADG